MSATERVDLARLIDFLERERKGSYKRTQTGESWSNTDASRQYDIWIGLLRKIQKDGV